MFLKILNEGGGVRGGVVECGKGETTEDREEVDENNGQKLDNGPWRPKSPPRDLSPNKQLKPAWDQGHAKHFVRSLAGRWAGWRLSRLTHRPVPTSCPITCIPWSPAARSSELSRLRGSSIGGVVQFREWNWDCGFDPDWPRSVVSLQRGSTRWIALEPWQGARSCM